MACDTSVSVLGGNVLEVSGGGVESSESLEEHLLLGISGKGEALDRLGGSGGSSGDLNSGVVESGGGTLGNSVSLVVGLVSNSKSVFSLGSLLGLGFDVLGGQPNGVLVGEALSGGVVEAGEVEGVSGETLLSGFASLLLVLENTVVSSKTP